MNWTRLLGCSALSIVVTCGCSNTTSAPQNANKVRQAGGIKQVGATEAQPEEASEIPEVSAETWLNCDGPQTLAGLRGNVVVIECWATWCGPCVKGIPHMNDMQARYSENGLRILSFTAEPLADVKKFQKRTKTPIEYPIGAGSPVSRLYGVNGIPHAFIVGRDGKPLWQGHPADPKFEQTIVAALDVKTAAVEKAESGASEE